MGCCFSKKRKKHPAGSAAFARRCCRPEDRDPPPPPSLEEEKVKEVLSETPSTKVRAEAKTVANVVAEEVLKVKAPIADACTVSDLGSCLSLATDERSETEAASESSVATSSVAGPERSPGRRPARKRAVSGELGLARRDRAVAAAYGVRSRSGRASPSPPPPRREPRDRRSPSPAAKPEQRRAASPAASLQRKPSVPSRPSRRVSPRRAREASPPPLSPPPLPSPPRQPEEDAFAAGREVSDGEAGDKRDDRGDGEGKESLENPLVSMECFIFL